MRNFGTRDLSRMLLFFRSQTPVRFTTEYGLWMRQWKGWTGDVPQTLTLRECSTVYLGLPQHTCKSFETGCSIPSYFMWEWAKLQSAAACKDSPAFHNDSQSQLNSLALLKINRDKCNELLSEDNMKRLVQAFARREWNFHSCYRMKFRLRHTQAHTLFLYLSVSTQLVT